MDNVLLLTHSISNNLYAKTSFWKSVNYFTYDRTFTRFDDVISYVGGLFGAIIGLMFVMNKNTKTAF